MRIRTKVGCRAQIGTEPIFDIYDAGDVARGAREDLLPPVRQVRAAGAPGQRDRARRAQGVRCVSIPMRNILEAT